MPRLTVDNTEVDVSEGSSVLDAARKLGIDIPTLCFREGYQASTSCMACVVKVKDRLVPACATIAVEGMSVESETAEIREARKVALELLLSDHIGDCIAPCHSACPAQMNIPLMIRQIGDGKLRDAIVTIKEQIAFPAVLGRICPAPCEKGCRRGAYDSPGAICLLKRYAADVDLAGETPYLPACKPPNGKRVAIVGAGSTGLSAAYYLLQEGYACTLFDDNEAPGGTLRYGLSAEELSPDVLDAEISIIEKMGAAFRMTTKVGKDPSLEVLRKDYDAILIAIGGVEKSEAELLGVKASANGIQVDKNTLQTDIDGVFAGGNAIRRRNKLEVRSVADGKTVATSIDQYLSGLPVTGPERPFVFHVGRLDSEDVRKLVRDVSEAERFSPSGGDVSGFSDQEAVAEARRCLHCDCRKASDCRLRHYAGVYGADPNRYKGDRRAFEPHNTQRTDLFPDLPEPSVNHGVIYEPGKCIACGLCVQIAGKAKEPLGLTFVGRGFDVRVDVPFNGSIAEGLQKAAERCVAGCPTGALVRAIEDEP